MRPVLFHFPFNLPLFGNEIKSYGVMMMIGFLTAIYFCARRVAKAKGDPDLILNAGFIALVGGVLGARLFFVIHYWDTQFAFRRDWLGAVLDCRRGGLEFYGGFLAAMTCVAAYFAWKRVSLRMYLDLITPALFWGLAITRVGCFLNGCCWGGICVADNGTKALPWAVRFPFGSPAHIRHWQEMRVSVPAELLMDGRYGSIMPLYRDYIGVDSERVNGPRRKARQATAAYEQAERAGADNKRLASLHKAMEKAKRKAALNDQMYGPLTRLLSKYGMSFSDLAAKVNLPSSRSLPVHPTQIYSSIAALLLTLFTTLLLRVRKRHGVVCGAALLMYPIQRFVLELVRTDNPQDTIGLSISQAVSLGVFTFAIVYLIVIYRLPLRSPLAVPFVPPPLDAPKKKTKRKK